MLSKDSPYTEQITNEAHLTSNVYDPESLGLSGEIRAVFPMAGDPSKMYLLDSTTDDKQDIVTLELYRDMTVEADEP